MSEFLQDYLDREGAARALGITTRTLFKYSDVPGGIPTVRLGGRRVLYRKESLQRWILAQERVVPTPTRRGGAR